MASGMLRKPNANSSRVFSRTAPPLPIRPSIRYVPPSRGQPMIYDFAVGRTNPATFPLDAFQRAAARAIARDYPHYTNYPGELGHEGLRKLMAQARVGARRRAGGGGSHLVDERLDAGGDAGRRGVDRTSRRHRHHRRVHLSRHDLDVSRSRAFGWSDCRSTPTACGPTRCERALEDLARKGTPPRFIYTEATYQNPTGTTIPRARRLEILALRETLRRDPRGRQLLRRRELRARRSRPRSTRSTTTNSRSTSARCRRSSRPACGSVTSWRRRNCSGAC